MNAYPLHEYDLEYDSDAPKWTKGYYMDLNRAINECQDKPNEFPNASEK